jgi:hypothetical protein
MQTAVAFNSSVGTVETVTRRQDYERRCISSLLDNASQADDTNLRAGAMLCFVTAALFFVSLVSGCMEKTAVADFAAPPHWQDASDSSVQTPSS